MFNGSKLDEENIQDKIDEELAEMEVDGSDSEGRSGGSGSGADPLSLRTTPNSIISITDEEGETIDLTRDDSSTIVIESRLREDTYKVLRILKDEQGPLRNFDEVYLYLEAHLNKPNRVQIVVEEFLGMSNIEDDTSRSPSPDVRQVDPSQVFQKGKGVGKNSKFKPIKDDATKDAENSNASKRNLSTDGTSSSPEQNKKIKLEETPTSSNSLVPVKVKKEKAVRREPLTEDMLHGPFDFSQHRSGANHRNSRRTQNLSQELQEIVEDSARTKRSSILAPPRLNHLNAEDQGSVVTPAKPVTPEVQEVNTDTQPPPTALPTPPSNRERFPSIEVLGEEVLEPEVVEIPDTDTADLAAVTNLAESLQAMFPDSPREYIQMRCVDLVGKDAAIERFTLELLENPNPPENWEQIYKKPFHVVSDPPENVKIPTPPAETQPPSSSSNGEPGNPSSSSSSQDLPEPDNVPEEKVEADGVSTGPGELDPVVSWEVDRHEALLSMFPDLCPDYLLNEVVRSISKPQSGEQEDATAQKLNLDQLNALFASNVERMFAMRTEERRLLPTRAQWETKRKEKEELEKWSGNMSVNDMLLLYSDDPGGYFGDPNRKPESVLYQQHAIEGLKHEFRFHSVTEIERAFKKVKFLYYPALKQLKEVSKNGKKTRKTKRPDIEIKFPTEPCIQFLKEKKYAELEEQIKAEKERRSADREAKIEAAKLLGNLKECLCCYSSDCLSEDMIQCKGGHLYCKECIMRGASVAIGDGKTVIECLGHCKEEIVWQELQKVLSPNVLSKLLQRRQAEEVGAAELDNLVTCPFCPYVTIMENPDDKVLVCRNPECGRDSCRLCQEPNHVPLRCDEVEKKDEEEERKKIEEQLSEAMMRECWKCKVKYFKEEGCNKMTCPRPGCGAKMCYLCKQPVRDYTHFYGQGGAPDKTRSCPLWTDNKKLHEQEVAEAAAKAKEELKKKNLTLKNDPTAGVTGPTGGGNLAGAAPDVAEVIAPGVPREVLVRQQRQIEDIIRNGGRPRGDPRIFHNPQFALAGLMGGPANRDQYIERMHEILRMREEQRANMRIIRQREQQALRELERVRVVQPPPAPLPAGFGLPQAVPEPAPFLDLVHEAHGRNIHIVQQPRLPFVAGPLLNPFPAPAHPPPPPPAVAAVRQMRQQELHHQLRERQRRFNEQQERREVVERLRRNREEVLRRQRRHRHDGRHRAHSAELRVERVPNAFQLREEEERNNQQEAVAGNDQRQNNRDFNFQDILDLDANGNNES